MESIWSRSCEIREREPLREDKETEIAVTWAGMAERFLQIPAESAKELSPGQGGVVFLKGERLDAERE